MKVIVTKKPCALAFALCLSLLSFACSAENDANSPGALHTLRLSDQSLRVEVAMAEIELMKGLMFREKLPEGQGMLFVYPRPNRLNFWMKNTSIPLDIGYFDQDGVLREIYPLQPYDLTPVESRRHDIQFALEVPRGWFEKHGVDAGDSLNLRDVIQALRARGAEPTLYGLRE